MMVFIIVGLPGSGKTYYINSIKTSFDYILDDFVTPDSLRAGLESHADRLIVSDPMFCIKKNLDKAIEIIKQFTDQIYITYFENDKEKALNNAKTREGKRVEGLIHLLSQVYNPPKVDKKIYQEV